MKPIIEPTEGQKLPTWADVDWQAVEANVGRLQERLLAERRRTLTRPDFVGAVADSGRYPAAFFQ